MRDLVNKFCEDWLGELPLFILEETQGDKAVSEQRLDLVINKDFSSLADNLIF